jgi:hypothetical protein
MALVAVLLGTGLLPAGMTPGEHRVWVERLGFDLDAARALRLWTLPFATVFQADPGVGFRFATLLVESAALTGLVEARRGAAQALSIFFVSDWVAAALRLVTLCALAALGSEHARGLLHVADTGSSAAATGALAAAAVVYRGTWRRLAAVILGGWLLYGALLFRLDVAVVHVWGATAGGLLAALLPSRAAHRALRPHIRMRGYE